MGKSILSLIRTSGIIFMFYIVINFYFFVVVAMMNDGVVVVYFNRLNEGLLECIMYALIAPLIVISFLLELKLYFNERRSKHEQH